MADTFIETAREVHKNLPNAVFLVPLATRETRLQFETAIYQCNARDLPIRMLFGHAHDAMMASDAVLVASGTATLEAALLKRPMAIAYKMARFSYRLMRRMGYLPYIGLPNILAGKFVVPEFIQDDATPENLAQALLNMYADKEASARVSEVFREIHMMLRQNTAEKAASAVIDCIPLNIRNHAAAPL
jgi:lipid-A-disaccharide synthase